MAEIIENSFSFGQSQNENNNNLLNISAMLPATITAYTLKALGSWKVGRQSGKLWVIQT